MQITIQDKIFQKYPLAQIGYLVADVKVQKTNPYIQHLKKTLMPQDIPPIWQKIYREDFQEDYPSSIEALLKRVASEKPLWTINSIVDLYNCCSVLSSLPMGCYDLAKIEGDIELRYAQEGEPFLGIGSKEVVQAKARHVVYADSQKLLCWLWNYKDAAAVSIDENTKQVIFFVDAIATSPEPALALLSEHLLQIHCTPTCSGILNQTNPSASL